MATPGFAPPRQPRAAGPVARPVPASPPGRRRSSGVTVSRTSRNGCSSRKGFERRRRYVPSNDATVTDCHRHETPRVSTRARGGRRGRTGRQQCDCRARDYRRGLSPYNTTSPTRRSASFSNRPARARRPVTPNRTPPTTTAPTANHRPPASPASNRSPASTEGYRPPAPEDGWRE